MVYIKPPRARKLPKVFNEHGNSRTDDYHWLNQRDNPEVLEYLRQENEYTKAKVKDWLPLQQQLYEEIKQRIPQTDSSVPYSYGDYDYYTRYEDGKSYPIYCRRLKFCADEQVLLDVNKLAEGKEFYEIGEAAVSHNQQLLAYSEDVTGNRIHTIRIKDLNTGEHLVDVISDVYGEFAWANDDQTIFYNTIDRTTLRAYGVKSHVLGSNLDSEIYYESDPEFNCHVEKSKSKQYIFIDCHHSTSNEYHYIDANNPSKLHLLYSRKPNHEYTVDHVGEYFYIKTNKNAKNYRLVRVKVSNADIEHWQEIVAHDDEVLIDGYAVYQDFIAVELLKGGLLALHVCSLDGRNCEKIKFNDPSYIAYILDTPEENTSQLRYGYTSLTFPWTVYEYDVPRKQTFLRKQQSVIGFNVDDYQSERVMVTSFDGELIPMSLVYRKDKISPTGNPAIINGYGAYGLSSDPIFVSERISLLDRGFVFAIAHVRGGEELGRKWYESGKLLQKKNSFYDFIACSKYLRDNYANKLFAYGGSAGGLLVAAVLNMQPDLYFGAVLEVPFVDVLTTMLDPNIPLTSNEYDEWGNPNIKQYYDYMFSYSPYDNIQTGKYPHILVTTALHDTLVQYFEPSKWVAKLRELKQNDTLLLLNTDMHSGHTGGSGRFKQYQEAAFVYSFIIGLTL